jgi:hypothetical protein
MKPKPFSPLNHLTVPCAMDLLLAGLVVTALCEYLPATMAAPTSW